MVRDGRDCAKSFNRRFNYNINRAIYNWKKIVKQARKDGYVAGKDRYFEIKYEDLTDAPEIHMKKICSFLEIPYDSQVLISNMPMYSGKNDQQKKIVSNSEKWRTAFTKKQVKKLEDIAGLTLKEFGYEVLHNLGDHDIPKFTLFVLRWVDRVNASINYYKTYMAGNNLRIFVKKIATSLKQSRIYKY